MRLSISKVSNTAIILFLFSLSSLVFCNNSLAGTGRSESSDIVLVAKGVFSSNSRTSWQLLPGQSFTTWFYYFSSSDSSMSADLQVSPAVSWLSVSPSTLTSTGCDDIIPVEYRFTAPGTPGFYSTTVRDINGNWGDVAISLEVTITPTPEEAFIFQLSEGETVSIFDTTTWKGFGSFSCIDNYVPGSRTVTFSQHPQVSWLTIQPSSSTLNLNETVIVETIITGDGLGNSFTYVVKEKGHSGHPDFYRIELQADTASVSLISPVTGELLGALTTHNILWASKGVNTLRIEFSADDGENYALVAANVPADSNLYRWEVAQTRSDSCRLKLTDVDNSDLFAVSQRFRIGDAIVITSPMTGERWIAGEPDTIRWQSSGVDSVRILFTTEFVDFNSPFDTLVVNYPANPGFFVWDVPEDILSARAGLVIDDFNNPFVFSDARVFKIKGYVLTRFTADSSYEAFDPAVHGWKFGNTKRNQWPESWWRQFDYNTGIDPVTQGPYNTTFTTWPFDAEPEDFPDWPLFVSVFGVEQCYFELLGSLTYRPSAFLRWRLYAGDWGGSCSGLAFSCFLGFERKQEFLAEFPELPSFNNVADFDTSAATRVVINELWTHGLGKEAFDHRFASRNKTATETLAEIKAMLLRSDGDTRPVYFRFPPFFEGGGAHAVSAYKVEKEPLNPEIEYVYIYDNNFPRDRTKRIVVDKGANTWEYVPYQWKSAPLSRFFLLLPASAYLSTPTLGKSSAIGPAVLGKPAGQAERMQTYHSEVGSIIITNADGQQIVYGTDNPTFDIPDIEPLVPITGYPHAPIGYDLPDDVYQVEMREHAGSSSYFSVLTGTLALTYGYSDADSALSDHLHIDDGLAVCFEDVRTKTANFQAIVIEERSEKAFDLTNCELSQNDSLHFSVADRRDLKVVNMGSPKSYDLRLTHAAAVGAGIFEHAGIALPANASHRIAPAWENLATQAVTIFIDEGNDGIIDDSLTVENQATGIETEAIEQVPQSFALFQNYPNPFNPTTTIRFALPLPGKVLLKVFNTLGQEVATLVEGKLPAGEHEIVFDAGRLPSGLYFYRLKANGFSQVKKLVLMR